MKRIISIFLFCFAFATIYSQNKMNDALEIYHLSFDYNPQLGYEYSQDQLRYNIKVRNTTQENTFEIIHGENIKSRSSINREDRFWRKTYKINTIHAYLNYLSKFSNGRYIPLAYECIGGLSKYLYDENGDIISVNWDENIPAKQIPEKVFLSALERAGVSEVKEEMLDTDERELLANDNFATRRGDSLIFYLSNGGVEILIDLHGMGEGFQKSRYIASYPMIRQWLIWAAHSNYYYTFFLDFDNGQIKSTYEYPIFNPDSTMFVSYRLGTPEFESTGLSIWKVNNKAFRVNDYPIYSNDGFSKVIWDGTMLLFEYTTAKSPNYSIFDSPDHALVKRYGYFNPTSMECPDDLDCITELDGTFIDLRDSQEYRWVRIGNQIWMAENLNFEADDSYCYDNNEENCKNYGRLYTWDIAMNGEPDTESNPSGVQGICPAGWHLPSYNEWMELSGYIGSMGYLSDKYIALRSCRQVHSPIGGTCEATEHPRWNAHDTHYGTNKYGFSALPGGRRFFDGHFSELGEGSYWWSSSLLLSAKALERAFYLGSGFYFIGQYIPEEEWYSVRCVQD